MADVGRSESERAVLADHLRAVATSQDRRSFRLLFDHFAPRVKAYAGKLGCQPQEAEEIAQETMARVWRKAAQFDPEKAAPSTWIFRIARNLRIDMYRRENRPELDENDPSLMPNDVALADQQVVQKEEEALLRDALNILPEEQLKLLRLSFFQDMPHAAIAEELDLPLGTVKSRLRLAMGKLKKKLEEADLSGSGGSAL